jgi:uncharacterized membrane protein
MWLEAALVLVALVAALAARPWRMLANRKPLAHETQGAPSALWTLGLGALLRRYTGTKPFVYVLGRAFLGTVVCVFVAGVLSQWSGQLLPGVGDELSLVARWLMAWGDGFVTGMLAAIFVAFKPEWLATWSDRLYLPRPD